MKNYTNCVSPGGVFIFGIHKPSYQVANLRKEERIESLGKFENGRNNYNQANFPSNDIVVENADWIFEIPNPLPFRGTTYIDKEWADVSAADYNRISLPRSEPLSFSTILAQNNIPRTLLSNLPQPLLLTLATCSTDPEDLMTLAVKSCKLLFNDKNQITGLGYKKGGNCRVQAEIYDHALFEAVANNRYLPDSYKKVMVLRPGAQGSSEIVGEWPRDKKTHVYEYLRKNSYISGGHYAANMSDDSLRYSIQDLSLEDMRALRHLYYQRSYVRIATLLELSFSMKQDILSENELEHLRHQITHHLQEQDMEELATLWGWNFGFDYAPTNYRLHASHQQIHQQYAMVPETVESYHNALKDPVGTFSSFSSGDMVAQVIEEYDRYHQSDFFTDYLAAIFNNCRMDGRTDRPSNLIVWQDSNAILFVPKAQTSQWELQLMTKPHKNGDFPGNIIETDAECRRSLDQAILTAQQLLEKLGAKMVTSIEYSKRISSIKRCNQPLLYAFLPKLPQSMGAFSEAQLRFINGHYPEDFAAACRNHL